MFDLYIKSNQFSVSLASFNAISNFETMSTCFEDNSLLQYCADTGSISFDLVTNLIFFYSSQLICKRNYIRSKIL